MAGRGLGRLLGLVAATTGAVASVGLGVAAYTAHLLNSPPRRTWKDDFSFSPFETDVLHERVSFVAEDGVTLRGWWFPVEGSSRVVVGLTGHKGCKQDLLGIGSSLWRAGNNVLLFDFRGCGESDTAPLSLAYNEMADARAAVEYARSRVSGASIGVVGYSMGAAIAILLAEQDPGVAAVVADSSFTGMREVVGHAFTRRRLPATFLVILTDAVNRWRHGYPFHAVRPIDAVSRIAPRPILIIHGAADEVVPVQHARELFAAAGQPKDLWIAEDTAHCGTYFLDRVEYVRRVSAFFARWFGDGHPVGLHSVSPTR